MGSSGREWGASSPEAPDASEPITLTDPDGAVTRVAPWSAWTREQVRRPGGESALVTRLDQGRLWFSSGRPKSPWLHEVHVGPAVVSTPGGRFQVSVESDGGASIACLAGRARVAAGLEGPVVLGPDQSAAVSSDGLTLVVLDRPGIDVEDPLDDPKLLQHPEMGSSGALVEQPDRAFTAAAAERRRWWWVPELAAAVAVAAVFIAAIALFVYRPSTGNSDAAIPATTRSTLPLTTAAPTTAAPTTVAPTTVATTTVAPTTAAPTTVTTAPPATSSPIQPVSPGATGVGVLQACSRAPGGVNATVRVRHQAGAPSRFEVTVAAVDRSGAPQAQGKATTSELQPGTIGSVDVLVPVDSANVTSCTVLGVASVA